MNAIEEAMARLDTTIGELQKQTDRPTREKEIAEKLKDFAPGERFSYAPESERLKVHGQILDEQRQRGGEALVAVEDAIRDDEAVLASVLADVQEPPDARRAWLEREGL